jgi:hypothetical protein
MGKNMMIECLLDNCPHHEKQHKKEPGPYCKFDVCAWDLPTMTAYLDLVVNGVPNPESILEKKDE